jgi:putative nucleotidyltransferase with HDIG domain
MSFLSKYPHLKIIQTIAAKRRASVYLVGGFLRDHFLSRPQTDFDFAVDKNAVAFARQFADAVKGAFVLLDDEHGCGRVVKKVNGVPWTFDFADFRAKTLKDDIASRDFTINTLYADLMKIRDNESIDGHIVDLKGARKDLKSRVIRMASAKAFKDDPLRLMRAYSLQATLGFKIEAKTVVGIKKEIPLIRNVSMERVREEFFKILSSTSAYKTLKDMDKVGFLEQVIPQLSVMFGVKQGGYHHLDVWKHSMEVLRQFELIGDDIKGDADLADYVQETVASNHSRLSLIKLAALLHDIGKPDTKKVEPDRTSFHGHEHVGRNITRIVAKHLKLSVRERHILEDLVLYHLRPGYLSNFTKPTEKSVFRYFRDTKDEAVSILLLSLADQRSTCGPLTTENDQKHHQKICMSLIKRYFVEKKKVPQVKLITGNDLIKKLKLKPSPLFAKILRSVEEEQALGKISTKQEALVFAAKIAG